MGKRERRAYLEAIRARYRRASKAGKTAILNEFCAVCGYHRRSRSGGSIAITDPNS